MAPRTQQDYDLTDWHAIAKLLVDAREHLSGKAYTDFHDLVAAFSRGKGVDTELRKKIEAEIASWSSVVSDEHVSVQEKDAEHTLSRSEVEKSSEEEIENVPQQGETIEEDQEPQQDYVLEKKKTVSDTSKKKEPVMAPEKLPEPEHLITRTEARARINTIKQVIHEEIGNPAAIVGSYGKEGRTYLKALLSATRASVGASSGGLMPAMHALEKAYDALRLVTVRPQEDQKQVEKRFVKDTSTSEKKSIQEKVSSEDVESEKERVETPSVIESHIETSKEKETTGESQGDSISMGSSDFDDLKEKDEVGGSGFESESNIISEDLLQEEVSVTPKEDSEDSAAKTKVAQEENRGGVKPHEVVETSEFEEEPKIIPEDHQREEVEKSENTSIESKVPQEEKGKGLEPQEEIEVSEFEDEPEVVEEGLSQEEPKNISGEESEDTIVESEVVQEERRDSTEQQEKLPEEKNNTEDFASKEISEKIHKDTIVNEEVVVEAKSEIEDSIASDFGKEREEIPPTKQKETIPTPIDTQESPIEKEKQKSVFEKMENEEGGDTQQEPQEFTQTLTEEKKPEEVSETIKKEDTVPVEKDDDSLQALHRRIALLQSQLEAQAKTSERIVSEPFETPPPTVHKTKDSEEVSTHDNPEHLLEPKLKTHNVVPSLPPVPATPSLKEIREKEYLRPDVTEGLIDLLYNWEIFRGSFWGKIGRGVESELYKEIQKLPMSDVMAGRFEGAKASNVISINDYVNAWRYEQGVNALPYETFEHYLRRVIHRILSRSHRAKVLVKNKGKVIKR